MKIASYTLPLNEDISLQLPQGAEVLEVFPRGMDSALILVNEPEGAFLHTRHFEWLSVGDTLPEWGRISHYVGTLTSADGRHRLLIDWVDA
jgi:hypothetical protein